MKKQEGGGGREEGEGREVGRVGLGQEGGGGEGLGSGRKEGEGGLERERMEGRGGMGEGRTKGGGWLGGEKEGGRRTAEEEASFFFWLSSMHSVLIGPGLGRSITLLAQIFEALEKGKGKGRVVLDADAFWHILRGKEREEIVRVVRRMGRRVVLTPNKVEAGRMIEGFLREEMEIDEKRGGGNRGSGRGRGAGLGGEGSGREGRGEVGGGLGGGGRGEGGGVLEGEVGGEGEGGLEGGAGGGLGEGGIGGELTKGEDVVQILDVTGGFVRQLMSLSKFFGGAIVLCKGERDLITDGEICWAIREPGCWKRSGGEIKKKTLLPPSLPPSLPPRSSLLANPSSLLSPPSTLLPLL